MKNFFVQQIIYEFKKKKNYIIDNFIVYFT